VTADAIFTHGFRVNRRVDARLTSSLAYAIRGSLVVEVEEYDAHGVTQAEVDAMMVRLLVRSSVGTSASSSST
jgi:hypothetical protein